MIDHFVTIVNSPITAKLDMKWTNIHFERLVFCTYLDTQPLNFYFHTKYFMQRLKLQIFHYHKIKTSPQFNQLQVNNGNPTTVKNMFIKNARKRYIYSKVSILYNGICRPWASIDPPPP